MNDPSASSHSPRRSWTRPIRCSIPAISARGGLGSRRLVAREGGGIVAGQGEKIADRLVQRSGGGRPEGERLSEVGERLAVRVEVACLLARELEPVGRFGLPAGEPEVLGDESGAGRPAPGGSERVGCAAVQEASPAEARALVRHLPRLLVAEVVHARVEIGEDPARAQLLDRRDGLLVAASADVANELRLERTTEHRGGSGDLPRHLAGRGQPCFQHVPDAGRQRPVGHVVPERVEILDDEERQAARLGEERVDQVR